MTESATILLADDDRAIRLVLAEALAERGMIVKAAADAATLWQWIDRDLGDCVVARLGAAQPPAGAQRSGAGPVTAVRPAGTVPRPLLLLLPPPRRGRGARQHQREGHGGRFRLRSATATRGPLLPPRAGLGPQLA